MRRLSLLLAPILLLTGCGSGGGGGGSTPTPPPGATTFYVRVSGSDDNDGTTPAKAFRNISPAATRVLKPGGVLYVGPGTYRAQPPPLGPSGTAVDLTSIAGTAAAPVQIIADSTGELTDDDPGEVIIDANDRPTAIRISRATYITVDGFTLLGAKGGSDAVGIQVRIKSDNVTIRNCTMRNNVNGIRVQDSDDVLIFNNLVVDNETAGIRIANGAQRARILDNTIADNGTRGISIGGSANQDGEGSTGATVRNNVVQNNGNVNVIVDDGPPDSLAGYTGNYNLVFAPEFRDQTKTYRPADIRGQNDVNADAVFVDAAEGDYRLDQRASPAVDTGNGAVDGALVSELFTRSTSPSGAPDQAPLDIGYHYPAAEPAP
jgi:parallel beta-helix repeat protein